VLGPFDAKRHMPLCDLDTVRDTLVAIHTDLKRVAGLEIAAESIETALIEMAVVERRRLARLSRPLLDARAYLRCKT
jgi:hypothetical protein